MAQRYFSEKAAWTSIIGFAEQALDACNHADLGMIRTELRRLLSLAHTMEEQVGEGVHTNPQAARKNPALVIWPNPGSRKNPLPATSVRAEEQLSNRVYEIAYKHTEDGQKYKHEFAPGVEMWLVMMGGRQAVVVFGAHGQDVYGDF